MFNFDQIGTREEMGRVFYHYPNLWSRKSEKPGASSRPMSCSSEPLSFKGNQRMITWPQWPQSSSVDPPISEKHVSRCLQLRLEEDTSSNLRRHAMHLADLAKPGDPEPCDYSSRPGFAMFWDIPFVIICERYSSY